MDKYMDKIRTFLKNHHAKHWLGILCLLAVSVFAVSTNYEANLLLSSLLNLPEHEAFDGTVMPIQEVPDWVHVPSADYDLEYKDMDPNDFIETPEYRLDYLTTPASSLTWGAPEDDLIHNTRITYPVLYAGNYNYLGHCGEGCGSHPAVDIKVPKGTPVHTIANGVVTKAGSSSGFGQVVVIKHVDVPDPDLSGQTTTLYSSYSHLSNFFVTVGDEVSRDEIIGEVGDTGTATTNHLHFQLDNAEAPWHPYWPFTTAEASAEGHDFWDAVNNGVGAENMYSFTEHPIAWIYDNAGFVAEDDDSDTDEVSAEDFGEINWGDILSSPVTKVDETEEAAEEAVEEAVEEELVEEEVELVEEVEDVGVKAEEIAEEEITPSLETSPVYRVDFDTPDFVMAGDNMAVTISLLDADGDKIENISYDGNMYTGVSDNAVASLSKSVLKASYFSDGEYDVNFYADHEGAASIYLEVDGVVYESDEVNIINEIKPFAKFGIDTDGTFVPGIEETVYVQALDINGEPTPSFYGNKTIELTVVEGDAELLEDELTKKDFTTGVAEVEFISEGDDDVVIEVTYGTKTVESDNIEAKLFSDFDSSDDYYDAISYLYKKGTVQGYPDGTLQPERTVSRVEALKLMFSGLDQDILDGLKFYFSDAETGQWYSDYLATAYSLGVVQGYSDGSFKPTQGVNRVEFLKMLFTTMEIDIDPVVSEDPYQDVSSLAWHAPYVQFSKEKNLFPISGSYFYPSESMSRIEVAEVIYRLIAVMQNDDETYSVLMKVK
jgi:hypothetical protein